MNLKNVTFLDPVPKLSVPNLCREFDCVYMGGKDSPLYRFGLCLNKMFDSMMAGKPVICAITTPRTYIEEYECGFRVDSGDTEGCKKLIMRIKDMPQGERNKMGINGRKAAVSKFNYAVLAEKFLSLVK